MAPVKRSKKKSKAQRMEERAFSVSLRKNKVEISNIYNGDQMGMKF